MEHLESAANFILNWLILFANGLLVIIYWLAGAFPHVLSLGCIGAVFGYFDPYCQAKSAHAPVRPGRRRDLKPSRAMQVFTAVCGGLWLIGGSLFPSPVPWIGLGMWVSMILAALMMPAEREDVLWRGKGFILIYSIALVGLRLFLSWFTRVSPYEWARVLGSVEEAQLILGQNRGLIATIGTWVVWFALPLPHFSYIIQRFLINPVSLVNPLGEAREIVRYIRERPD